MSDTQTDRDNDFVVWFKQLGSFRDAILVMAGGLYAMGYFVRQFNAVRNNLGWLPGIDVQYFVAGIVPTLVLMLAIGFIKGLNFLKSKVYALETTRPKIFRLIQTGELLVVGASIVLVLLSDRVNVSGAFNVLAIPTILFIDVIFRRPNWLRAFFAWYAYTVPVLFGTLLFVLFLLVGYPYFPQELGGTYPRCAYLDLDTTKLSGETISTFVPPTISISSGSIVRSKQVFVLASTNDFILVRTKPAILGENVPSFELKKDTVAAVDWHCQ